MSTPLTQEIIEGAQGLFRRVFNGYPITLRPSKTTPKDTTPPPKKTEEPKNGR